MKEARAVVCRQANSEVVVDTIHVESPHRPEVMIEMAACGVCHSDLSAANGTIPLPPPIVLGHEGAGSVVEVGEGVEGLAVVDSVVKINRDLPLDRAALVGCSVMTGFGAATRTVQVLPGSVVVVFGAGG